MVLSYIKFSMLYIFGLKAYLIVILTMMKNII